MKNWLTVRANERREKNRELRLVDRNDSFDSDVLLLFFLSFGSEINLIWRAFQARQSFRRKKVAKYTRKRAMLLMKITVWNLHFPSTCKFQTSVSKILARSSESSRDFPRILEVLAWGAQDEVRDLRQVWARRTWFADRGSGRPSS